MAMRQIGYVGAGVFFSATLLAALTSCTSAHTQRPSGGRFGAPASSSSVAPHGVAAPPRRIPGDDPSIQRWFLKVGKAQVAFDNALFRAEQGIARHVTSMCRPLDRKVQSILSALPRLRNIRSRAGSEIADAIEPGMKTFKQMGDRCAAGDFAGARVLMPTGVRQQADAQTKLDEILDGDANLGGSQ